MPVIIICRNVIFKYLLHFGTLLINLDNQFQISTEIISFLIKTKTIKCKSLAS